MSPLATGRLPEFLRVAMLGFCDAIITSRPPDFVLGGYMKRWRLAPYGDGANAYIHVFSGSDSDRALHDHPYDNVTCVLRGEYNEHFHVEPLRLIKDGERYDTRPVRRSQGEVIERPATTLHRVAMIGSESVTTLFFVGGRSRMWGFLTPEKGWIDWRAYETAYEPQIASDVKARLQAQGSGE